MHPLLDVKSSIGLTMTNSITAAAAASGAFPSLTVLMLDLDSDKCRCAVASLCRQPYHVKKDAAVTKEGKVLQHKLSQAPGPLRQASTRGNTRLHAASTHNSTGIRMKQPQLCLTRPDADDGLQTCSARAPSTVCAVVLARYALLLQASSPNPHLPLEDAQS